MMLMNINDVVAKVIENREASQIVNGPLDGSVKHSVRIDTVCTIEISQY